MLPTILLFAFSVGLVAGLGIAIAIIELYWKRHWHLLFVPRTPQDKFMRS